MFKRKDSNKPLPATQPGNLDALHQQIMLLMIDEKYDYLNQNIFEEIKDLFYPLKESQDNIIKKLLESNMSLTLKNNTSEREQEKILKIC